MTNMPDCMEKPSLFAKRHIGPSTAEQTELLKHMGFKSTEDFLQQALPTEIYQKPVLNFEVGCAEHEALNELQQLAQKNQVTRNFIGLGYHPTFTPSVIARNVLENPAWYTAYTPYQPEISQGRLEALLNFQQMIMDLTGMTLANASLLDEATAAAEAMTLAYRVHKNKQGTRFLIAPDTHPQVVDVVCERAKNLAIKVQIADPCRADLSNVVGVLLQYPSSSGALTDYSACADTLHEYGGICCVATDLLALTLLKPPGEWGGDIVVGNSQRFGVPLGYGGPHAAFIATHDAFRRSVPGRIIGVAQDIKGARALRMALQTREQHIRREKANSNICTAQALLANMAAFFAIYHGPEGLTDIAQNIYTKTQQLAQGLQAKGYQLLNNTGFDTLSIVSPEYRKTILENAEKSGINLRSDQDSFLGISLNETVNEGDLRDLLALFPKQNTPHTLEAYVGIPNTFKRESAFLQHPVFNSHHSETAMMRYLHRLARRDLSLEYSMIPLGSCTMKLNAASEMLPISWPEFSQIHPFAPENQVTGYMHMIHQLGQWLCAITGFDSISMQPNSGAQGEYAGLLCIRKYLESIGESNRHICLIPSSAHGTNPASAKMAGLDVKVVRCDKNGNVDLDDVAAQIEKHGDEIACIMITYPSTHGVYESGVVRLCEMLHKAGAQVYMDGANLNAQLGLMQPSQLGADVAHLNLHKTFAIPHGGGGPGMGPIGVQKHLTPFLPGHCMLDDKPNSAVSAAPFGSSSILAISWMYIRMLGAQGVTQATQVALINANYIAHYLGQHYPVLYRSETGYIAHECILDIRPIKSTTGISELDIAKRLIDYGFHAPTISFPVAGTLMIEPTESEDKKELDRFIHAMVQIRQEITQVEQGQWPKDNNPLVNAPHTAEDLTQMDWPYPYDRNTAVFPVPELKENKFWPAVKRLDDVYGDRNFCCACT